MASISKLSKYTKNLKYNVGIVLGIYCVLTSSTCRTKLLKFRILCTDSGLGTYSCTVSTQFIFPALIRNENIFRRRPCYPLEHPRRSPVISKEDARSWYFYLFPSFSTRSSLPRHRISREVRRRDLDDGNLCPRMAREPKIYRCLRWETVHWSVDQNRPRSRNAARFRYRKPCASRPNFFLLVPLIESPRNRRDSTISLISRSHRADWSFCRLSTTAERDPV